MTARTTAEKYGPISIATVVGWIPLIAILWAFGEPWLVQNLNAAMANEIDTRIEQKVHPLQGAFGVLVKRDIAHVRERITGKKYEKEMKPEEWTRQDAKDLSDLEAELAALEAALKELGTK